ncbi:MAG: InlB B-repeat-containing protein [Chitinispirillales bacterium]|jgi:uncharacterized protein (TIGR02145 family)/uncharacterized repeat protein (TIGR02543 family)|nr:InlB B-repeat-containing protein [Chitinispirillales bacterium]
MMGAKKALFLSAAVFAGALSFMMAGCVEKTSGAGTYKITVNRDPAAGGSVTLDPAQPEGGYASGTEVTVTAAPNAGYLFDGWVEDSEKGEQFTVKMTRNLTLTAKFKQAFALNVTILPSPAAGQVTKSPNKTGYEAGDVVTLKPVPDTAKFAKGYWNGDPDDTRDSITVTVTKDTAVSYTFTPKYALETAAFPKAGGTLRRDKFASGYVAGTVVTVTATTDTNYVFTGWTWSGANLSDVDTSGLVATVTIGADSALSLTANFRQEKTILGGDIVDSRDQGRSYGTVIIGGYRWTAANLNYETPEGEGDSWCYDNADSNCVKYGRLYDWDAAVAACPSGWSLPDSAAWEHLVRTAGGNYYVMDALQSNGGWGAAGRAGGHDDYGFTALPGGKRSAEGSFDQIKFEAYWWSATEVGSGNARNRYIIYNNEDDSMGNAKTIASKADGYSVRCIQDVTVAP